MSLPSSMADFVPCDRLLQKAYYLIPSLYLTPLPLSMLRSRGEAMAGVSTLQGHGEEEGGGGGVELVTDVKIF